MRAKISNCYVLQRIQDAFENDENPKELWGVFVGKAKIAKARARLAMMNLLRHEDMPEKDEACSSGGIEIWNTQRDMFLIERQVLFDFRDSKPSR